MEQVVKTYKFKYWVFWMVSAERQFRKDAKEMAKQGWHVSSQSATERIPGMAKITAVYQR